MFGDAGQFAYSNAAARDILTMLGYGMKRTPENHDVFVQTLKFYGAGAEEESDTGGGVLGVAEEGEVGEVEKLRRTT